MLKDIFNWILGLFRGASYDDTVDEESEAMNWGVDYTTGLLNRESFDLKLVELIDFVFARETRLGIIFFEVDYFKEFYQNSGQRSREACIKSVAVVSQELIRRRNEHLFRFNESTFALLVHNMSSETFRKTANNIRLGIMRARIKHRTVNRYISVSVGGISFWPISSDGELIGYYLREEALKCLKESKKSRHSCEVIRELGTIPTEYEGKV